MRSEAPVIFQAVFTMRCEVSWLEAAQLPNHTVMQLIRKLSVEAAHGGCWELLSLAPGGTRDAAVICYLSRRGPL